MHSDWPDARPGPDSALLPICAGLAIGFCTGIAVGLFLGARIVAGAVG